MSETPGRQRRAEYVFWGSSPNNSLISRLAALDKPLAAPPPALRPLDPPPTRATATSELEVAALADPATELLDKYDSAAISSSPPPTWPASTPRRAAKHISDCTGVRPGKRIHRMYSPGYLRRAGNLKPFTSKAEDRAIAVPASPTRGVASPTRGVASPTRGVASQHSLCAERTVTVTASASESDKENVPPVPPYLATRSATAPAAVPLSALVSDLSLPSLGPSALLSSEDQVKAEPHTDTDSDLDWDDIEQSTSGPAITVGRSGINKGPKESLNTLSSSAALAGPKAAKDCAELNEIDFDDLSDFDVDNFPSSSIGAEASISVVPPLGLAIDDPCLHRYWVERAPAKDVQTRRRTVWGRHKDGVTKIELEQSWSDADVRVGDFVHIVGDYDNATSHVTVDHKHNFLIILPDVLVSCTNIADSFRCEREVILRGRQHISTELSEPLVYGSIIHEVIQENLLKGRFTMTDLRRSLRQLLADRYLEDLAVIGVTVKDAERSISERLKPIIEWARDFFVATPTRSVGVYRSAARWKLSLSQVQQLEKDIWSPKYGIKGKLDVTLMARTNTMATPSLTPLEIKTGSDSNGIAHRAQVMLYSLLLADHLRQEVPWGLLYYSKTSTIQAVPTHTDDLRGLLQKRNSLARYLSDTSALPGLATDAFACRYCPRQAACSLYAGLHQTEISTDFVFSHEFATRIELIRPQDYTFFAKWDGLLTLEGADAQLQTSRIWRLPAHVREQAGEAFASVKVAAHVEVLAEGIKRTYRYELRNNSAPTFPQHTRLLEGQPLIVSDDRVVAIARGFVTRRSDDDANIIISVDQPLVVGGYYRVDFDAYDQPMTVGRSNLIAVLTAETEATTRLRNLIVDKAPPRFVSGPDCHIPDQFNSDQASAMRKVLSAQDYALVLGMPGTGKTTTIVAIVEMLVQQGKTVLISGYTNSAVDNIVMKLGERGADVLRLGHPLRVHDKVKRFLGGFGAKRAKNEHERESIYLRPPIVATTSLSIRSWLFTQRRFDYCIVDEASQLTLPACLGPLRFADRFVLVGDHYQLQPLVRDRRAAEGGLAESLFKSLCDAHPFAVASLTHQYRMSADIMRLSSELVYGGKLRCGSVNVANQELTLRRSISVPKWSTPIFDPKFHVVFLDTDSLPAPETALPEGVVNEGEAALVAAIVFHLRAAGVNADQLGVISVYRHQRALLQEHIKNVSKVEAVHDSVPEILTVDQAQGRDKDCVIISLVRSNDQGTTGMLLKDWRRVNVTFTRAKKKLVIVGSRHTLRSAAELDRFLHVIEANGWVFPAGRFEAPLVPVVSELQVFQLPRAMGDAHGSIGGNDESFEGSNDTTGGNLSLMEAAMPVNKAHSDSGAAPESDLSFGDLIEFDLPNPEQT